jgi:hypothetical protein
MTEEQKVFEEYPQANCNTCRSYMLDQCDGVPIGDSRKCTAYEAVRNSDLPMQIEKLEKRINSNARYNTIMNLLLLVIIWCMYFTVR